MQFNFDLQEDMVNVMFCTNAVTQTEVLHKLKQLLLRGSGVTIQFNYCYGLYTFKVAHKDTRYILQCLIPQYITVAP